MRIAQIAPLHESVPPRLYGGTERVVSYLTEELVRLGHDVTLFASGDSVTGARLVGASPEALRLNTQPKDALAMHLCLIEQVSRQADRFDILHFHVDYLHFPWSRRNRWPHVTTLHGRLDLAGLPELYDEFNDMPVVSISDSQRVPLPHAHWVGTVYHGLPTAPLADAGGRRDYLAFLGRISPEKRVDRAIEIARRAGWPLKIAAKVDRADQDYFNQCIKPLLSQPGVEFLNEISEREKPAFLAGAHALLFPIDWPEPFGLVMIEAMSQGTPVIAWRGGSVEEVITPGVTGVIVDSLDEAVAAVEKVDDIDRTACREVFEARFSVRRMADDYVHLYELVIEEYQDGSPPTQHHGRVA